LPEASRSAASMIDALLNDSARSGLPGIALPSVASWRYDHSEQRSTLNNV
jgi:hypothetical protein